MPFNSIVYFLFLIVVASIFFVIPQKAQNLWILVSSCFFYYWYSSFFLVVLLIILILNYFFGIVIYKVQGGNRKMMLILAITVNILILSFYKYCAVLYKTFSSKAVPDNSFFSAIIVPLGLSYLIFSIIAYQIEVKRTNIVPEYKLGIFLSAFMFFPKLAQGPIEKPQNILPQFHTIHNFDYSRLLEGLKYVVWGLFKKLVVADRLAIYINAVYNNYSYHNGTTLFVATILYSFQIYADFSGYTDIAIGSAKILGFNLTSNFNRPYFSSSVKEFWNRWHITFSAWLRDYIFLPMAVTMTRIFKREKFMMVASERIIYAASIIFTFTICGLWHGVGLNFLIWGLLFGISLSIINWTNKLKRRLKKILHISKESIPFSIVKISIVFLFISMCWIFFRAENTETAFIILIKIFTEHGAPFIGSLSNMVYSILAIFMILINELFQVKDSKSNLPFAKSNWIKEQFSYLFLVILILLFGVFDGGQFIYFQF
jgi:alginate O-acetyltransferase complex protein AlgI